MDLVGVCPDCSGPVYQHFCGTCGRAFSPHALRSVAKLSPPDEGLCAMPRCKRRIGRGVAFCDHCCP